MIVHVYELGDLRQVNLHEASGHVFPTILDDGMEKLAVALLKIEAECNARIRRYNQVFTTTMITPQGTCSTNIDVGTVDDITGEDIQSQYKEILDYLENLHRTQINQQLKSV